MSSAGFFFKQEDLDYGIDDLRYCFWMRDIIFWLESVVVAWCLEYGLNTGEIPNDN